MNIQPAALKDVERILQTHTHNIGHQRVILNSLDIHIPQRIHTCHAPALAVGERHTRRELVGHTSYLRNVAALDLQRHLLLLARWQRLVPLLIAVEDIVNHISHHRSCQRSTVVGVTAAAVGMYGGHNRIFRILHGEIGHHRRQIVATIAGTVSVAVLRHDGCTRL